MDDLTQWLSEQLDEDERIARAASHVLRDGAHWSLDEWHGREQPHSLIAQGTAEQPVALGHFTADPVPTEQALHIAAHDPARVLREIDSKRRIIDAYETTVLAVEDLRATRERLSVKGQDTLMTDLDLESAVHKRDALQGVLRLLALPYEDRPGYREEWRP